MKAYGGVEWRYSSTSLDLGSTWRWVVRFTPLPIYPRWKSPLYPLDRRLSGPQSRSRHCGEEKILALVGIEPRSSTPSLYQLSYPDSLPADNSRGKVMPVIGCGGPYSCETSRLPHFLDNRLTDAGDVSLTRQPPFTPQEDSWYSFLLEAESTPGS
jgi:hypothetical protein